MRLDNYEALWLLWSLPLLLGVYAYSFYRKRNALRAFATSDVLQRINKTVSRSRQITKAAILLLAAAAIIVALTGPAWNPRPERITRRGRDIVVILDVSRSMLAEDIKPNRLERAKIAIGDLIDGLEGDRIGIIAFAGTAVVKCPLTQDYAFARMALADIAIGSISRGGTNIGDAIRKANNDVFDEQQRDFKDLIIITDGEDHDSFPDKAAEKAAQQGIRIFTIGFGNENEGMRIPITTASGEKTFLKHDNEEVWSRLDGDLLRRIAFATQGGRYVGVGTDNFDLDNFYRNAILPAGRKQLESTTIMRYDERFQLFLALALVLIVLEAFVSERKKS